MRVRGVWTAVVIAASLTMMAEARQGAPLYLDCEAPFTESMTLDDLKQRFGAASVVSRDIDVGEGFAEPGATIFPGTSDQADVVWMDPSNQRRARSVRVLSETSRWRSRRGLRIGLRLKDVERLNGRPFRLMGFGWDRGGAVMSWSGGHLGGSTGVCHVRARFHAPFDASAYRQVIGDREFSSGHPAMQELNPVVSELSLLFLRN